MRILKNFYIIYLHNHLCKQYYPFTKIYMNSSTSIILSDSKISCIMAVSVLKSYDYEYTLSESSDEDCANTIKTCNDI